MKSVFYSAIFLFMLILMFSSCGKEHTAAELMDCVLSSQEGNTPIADNSYLMSAESHSKNYLSPQLKRIIYYGGREEALCGEFDLLCDYAVRLSDDDCPYEIHIFKLRYKSDGDTIEKILKRRLELIRSKQIYLYSPEDFEKYAAGATIFRKGNFIVLLALADAEKAVDAIGKLLN